MKKLNTIDFYLHLLSLDKQEMKKIISDNTSAHLYTFPII